MKDLLAGHYYTSQQKSAMHYLEERIHFHGGFQRALIRGEFG